jgi:RHS repeat-associated protein
MLSKSARLIFLAAFSAACFLVTPLRVQASTQPYISAHQINFATGNKYLSATDVQLSGPAGTLSFTRTYNSQNNTASFMGYGWTTTFTEKLIVEATAITLVQKGGRHVVFKNDGSGNWINETGKKRVITTNASGYQLKEASGTISQFDSTGNLQSITDRNNNTRTYTYSATQLASISDNFGRSISFAYTDGKLSSVSSGLGTWSYTYQNDNLVTVTKPDTRTIQYLYEDPADIHNLTGIIDESGARVLTVGYDTQDRAISSAKEDGTEQVTIAYPTASTREVTNSLGIKTTYTLDVLHGVVMVGSMSGPGCSSCGGSADTQYVYNSRLQAIESTDANEVKTTYTYDEAGNTTKIIKAFGTPLAQTIDKTYDPATNQVATITRPSVANPGQQTAATMTYDGNGNMIGKKEDGFAGTASITRTTGYIYNSYGQVTAIDGPRTDIDDTIAFDYYPNDEGQGNNRGNLYRVTDALDHAIIYSDYNAFGQAETITDANGIVTTRSYNGDGRLVATTTAGLTTSYIYTPAGDLQTVTLPGSRVVTYSYNPAGKVEKIADNAGNAISYAYDSEGRKTGEEIRDPQNTLTRYAGFGYDSYGRMDRVTLPGDAEESSAYDLVGNLKTTVGATTMQTDYQYDALNRLLSVTEAGESVAGYTYDAHDNISQVTDDKGHVTHFTYDDFGRRLSKTAADTGTTTYAYDKAGNLVSAVDAKGQTVSFAYDGLNRPISQNYAGGGVLFSYDEGSKAIGHLSGITDSEGTVSFAYDQTGRIASETRVIDTTSHTIGYSWDTATGDLAGMTYPSGLNLSYEKDAIGRVSAIALNGTPLISAVTHLPFGPLKAATLGSVNLTREYDQRYNVMRIRAGGLDYVYSRNTGGNVTSIDNSPAPAVEGGQTDYQYSSANNRLTGTTGTAPKTYSFDAVGNMVSDGTNTFNYDGLNRLVGVENQGITVATYGYDSSNRRIRKTVGTTTIHYLYDLNSQLIAETLADGTPLREYIYLDGEPLALREYQTNPGTYYFINDHLGTPQQLVDGSGTVVWQAAYLPFGKAQVLTATVQNNLRFPGQYYDAETGLHYNWHRFYDPETGRYISADPIGLDGGMNLYAYVQNNPVNWVDPWGLHTQWEMFRDWLMDPSKNHWWNDPNHWTTYNTDLGELMCFAQCIGAPLLQWGWEEQGENRGFDILKQVARNTTYVKWYVDGGKWAYTIWDGSRDFSELYDQFPECACKCGLNKW